MPGGSGGGGVWVFPTKHPKVKNPDGSSSNVRLGSFTEGKKIYAVPTMVEGKQLTGKAAFGLAKKHGLGKYPSFETVGKAEKWIKKNHGNISAPRKNGKLKAVARKKRL